MAAVAALVLIMRRSEVTLLNAVMWQTVCRDSSLQRLLSALAGYALLVRPWDLFQQVHYPCQVQLQAACAVPTAQFILRPAAPSQCR